MRLLVAPWGNPKWSEVDYLFDGERIRSRTSLTAIQRAISPDRTLILVLDTLASRGSDYEEVERGVRERVRGFAEENGLMNFEIIVAPGVGNFKNGEFRGSMLDYYHYTMFRLAEELAEGDEEGVEVHLDLTHGINFMPVLTYRALKELLGIASIFTNARLVVYNSDPYSKDVSKELIVNKLEDEIVRPEPPSNLTEEKRPVVFLELSEEEREVVRKEKLSILDEVEAIRRREVLAFMGGLLGGLPLSVYTFFVSSEDLRRILLRTLEVYRSYIEVSEGDRLSVRRKIGLGSDFRTYVLAYLMSRFLERRGVGRKRKVSLKDIDRLREEIFWFDERSSVTLQKEVHHLKAVTYGIDLLDWTTYRAVEERGSLVAERLEDGPDERNFLAHGGLERNVVEIAKIDGEIYLRYSDRYLSTIKRLSSRILRPPSAGTRTVTGALEG